MQKAMRLSAVYLLLAAAVQLAAVSAMAQEHGPEIIALGGRRELFLDHYLIASISGSARLELKHPVPRELAVVHDAPWEGNTCAYHTVFRDGDVCRMYYRGSHFPGTAVNMKEDHPQLTCYAESKDGVTWYKPDLGLFEFNGSTANNIVWMGPGSHDFCPFKDANPDCASEAAYKALGVGKGGLLAFRSADALHWELLRETPVITKGAFDSQNLAFWDSVRACYVDYHRGFTKGVRAIMTCTSRDFLTWTEPVWLEYPPDTPDEHLYTNQILPYYRAPQIKLGFPKRFHPQRRAIGNRMAGLSDGVFMSSRDGLHFTRWLEAFVRPGPQRERWVNRNNMTAWGIIETASSIPGCPNELSVYSTEGYYQGDNCAIRRYTLRLDGFVSINAPMTGGEMVTKPLTFAVPEIVEQTPAPVGTLENGPVSFERDKPIRGIASLRFHAPGLFQLPDTQKLGNSVTFSLATRGIPNGHRRFFSAYNGGPVAKGTREFVFDLFAGTPYTDGSALRFTYDGVGVNVKEPELLDWDKVSSEDATCHFAATWEDGVVKVYFNGKRVGETGALGRGPVELALGDMRFGEDYPPTSLLNEPFLGVVDDILVLRRALSEQEVARLATDGPDFLVAAGEPGVLYTMDPDKGATLSDQLTADGASDASLVDVTEIQDGDCQLLLNVSTSAGGSVRVELQDREGNPIPGYSLDDCDLIFGDEIERPVAWHKRTELKQFAGQPVRLRFELKDADLYAMRFGKTTK